MPAPERTRETESRSAAAPKTVHIPSEKAELSGLLYGKLPSHRAVLLCHGSSWDASGWADVPLRLLERQLPALALNFRGYGGSTGRTTRESAVTDAVRAAEWLRVTGAYEVALIGASMGGSAVLMASSRVLPENVVALSAPVRPISAEDAREIKGRKLFLCADRDFLGAARSVKRAFEDALEPKEIRLFAGRQHSLGMFKASYGETALTAVLDFVALGLPS